MISHPSRFNPQQVSRSYAFLLLEVVLALGILGMAATVLMRSYAMGATAIQRSELITTACMLASGLMDELEVFPPESSRASGTFGDDFPGFSWDVEVQRDRLRYDHATTNVPTRELEDLLIYVVTITYAPPGIHRPYTPLYFSYHPTSIELFSMNAKFENQIIGE